MGKPTHLKLVRDRNAKAAQRAYAKAAKALVKETIDEALAIDDMMGLAIVTLSADGSYRVRSFNMEDKIASVDVQLRASHLLHLQAAGLVESD